MSNKERWIIKSAVFSLSSFGWNRVFREYCKFKIYGIDIKEWNIKKYIDRFKVVPKATEENEIKIIETIYSIIHEVSPSWIISGPEEEVLILAKFEDEFNKKQCFIFHPPLDTLNIITDKYKAYKYLNNYIPMPETYLLSDFKKEKIKNKNYLIKKRRSRGSSGIYNLDNLPILTQQEEKEYIIQEFLEGREFSVDVLFDMEGKILNILTRERIEVDSGIAIATRTFFIDDVIQIIEFLSDKLIFRGMVNFQFFESNGIYKLTDINPRFGGASIINWFSSNSFKKNLKNLLTGNWRDLRYKVINKKSLALYRFFREVIVINDKTYYF